MDALYNNFKDQTGPTHPKASLRVENTKAVCLLHQMLKNQK